MAVKSFLLTVLHLSRTVLIRRRYLVRLGLLAALLVWLAPAGLLAFGSTSGADFLTQSFSARAAGQSGSYVSKSMDISTMAVNPSGLSYMRFPEVNYYHNALLGGFQNEYIAVGLPTESLVKNQSTFPKAIRFLHQMRWGMMVAIGHAAPVDIYGNDSDTAVDSLDVGYWVFGLGGAYNLRSYRIGATLKFFGQTLGHYSTSSVAMDLGAQKAFEVPRFIPYPRRNNLRAGLVFQNVGLGVSYEGTGTPKDGSQLADPGITEDIPMTVKPSVTYGLFGDRFQLIDFSLGLNYYMLDSTVALVTGLEYRVFNAVYFRMGTEVASTETNFSMGVGGKYTFRKVKYRLDYAYLPRLSGVDDNHTIALAAELQFVTGKQKKRISSIGILEGEEAQPEAPPAPEDPKKLKITPE